MLIVLYVYAGIWCDHDCVQAIDQVPKAVSKYDWGLPRFSIEISQVTAMQREGVSIS